jgi:hypothetical protein
LSQVATTTESTIGFAAAQLRISSPRFTEQDLASLGSGS